MLLRQIWERNSPKTASTKNSICIYRWKWKFCFVSFRLFFKKNERKKLDRLSDDDDDSFLWSIYLSFFVLLLFQTWVFCFGTTPAENWRKKFTLFWLLPLSVYVPISYLCHFRFYWKQSKKKSFILHSFHFIFIDLN